MHVSGEGSLTLSIIIPVYNEQDNIEPVYAALIPVLEDLSNPFDILFVDDGSRDGTASRLEMLAKRDPRVKVIVFKKNFGQTAAMMAGIDNAAGDILIPMDGDLQNDPKDIPKLLAKLAEGNDVVSGWRKDRKDNPIKRNLPSRMANRLISTLSGVHLHDYGCSLKAYRRDVLQGVRLYGEMHRFVPIYASWQGGRVSEVPVQHHPRIHGESKYGLERVFKVLLDLIVIKFLAKYATKPIYVFGTFGMLSISLSLVAGVTAFYLKYVRGVSFILTPLPLLTVMTFITGVMSVLMGLLAEIIMRIYYESQGKKSYLIRRSINLGGKI